VENLIKKNVCCILLGNNTLHVFFERASIAMKKFYCLSLLSAACIASVTLDGAQSPVNGGPLNADWFYNENNPYRESNDLYQIRKWDKAASSYERILSAGVGSEYDQNMARVNLASCEMAQGKATENWNAFDALIGISQEQRLTKELINGEGALKNKVVLARTDYDGIGDIAHFLKTAHELKKRTGCKVIVSVRNFLKPTFAGAIAGYGLELVGEKDEQQPKVDYTTHIIGLLGHLKMDPASLASERVMLTAPEDAIDEINQHINPLLAQGKTVVAVFRGEDRQAILIGGKRLPLDAQVHGRHLDSDAFKALLRKHPNVVLMDCGTPISRVAVDEDQKNQYMVLPAEKQPFATTIALALAMNLNKKIIAVGADNGPTNVFACALTKEAQRRMALIIPNGSRDKGEYDMRLEGKGKGDVYTQTIFNCPVYKCQTPADQTAVIEKAYHNMMLDDSSVVNADISASAAIVDTKLATIEGFFHNIL
jgi:hypothetical protein